MHSYGWVFLRIVCVQYRKKRAAAAEWSPRFSIDIVYCFPANILVITAILSMLALFTFYCKNIMQLGQIKPIYDFILNTDLIST